MIPTAVACVGAVAGHARQCALSSVPQFVVWALIIVAVRGSLPIVWSTGRTILLDLGTNWYAAFQRWGVPPVG